MFLVDEEGYTVLPGGLFDVLEGATGRVRQETGVSRSTVTIRIHTWFLVVP